METWLNIIVSECSGIPLLRLIITFQFFSWSCLFLSKWFLTLFYVFCFQEIYKTDRFFSYSLHDRTDTCRYLLSWWYLRKSKTTSGILMAKSTLKKCCPKTSVVQRPKLEIMGRYPVSLPKDIYNLKNNCPYISQF